VALFWIVRETDAGRKFYLQEAGSDLDAARRSAMAGFEGALAEVIPLDARTAQRVSPQDIGRVMSMDEAQRIIEGRT
jgi:hypothetical protein